MTNLAIQGASDWLDRQLTYEKIMKRRLEKFGE